MTSSAVIPIAFWNSSKPGFRISSLCLTPNSYKLVTGSYTGQLCVWNLNLETGEIFPKSILIGHEHSISSMVSTNEYVISCCENGKICRWNLDDGYCSKTNKSLLVHRVLQLFKRPGETDELLFSCGDYSEIFILHSFTLQVIFMLNSKYDFNWISNFHVITSLNSAFDIVSGISINGCIKVWKIGDFSNDIQYEIYSLDLHLNNAIEIKYSSDQTEVLVISNNCWLLFDSEFSNCKCRVASEGTEKLLGGKFANVHIVIWTNEGKFYIYSVKNNKHELVHVLLNEHYRPSFFDPIIKISDSNTYMIFGDLIGNIKIWGLNFNKEDFYHLNSITLNDKWILSENSLFNSFLKCTNVTCCIYVLKLDKFFVGCFDGSIVIIPAIQSIMSFYFKSAVNKPLFNILQGHSGRINCLLYPYEMYSHFDNTLLVSGGSDFSVCVWDVFKLQLLHKFCVHGGEVLKLLVPPEDCSIKVKYSVCSVSSDHSVAVLNLKDQRCIILASRHLFPIYDVYWKPLDDFIIIECYDGTVYVWQIETGHLDRVIDGITAQEIVHACTNSQCDSPLNFYLIENVVRNNSMKREVFQVSKTYETDFTNYFKLSGFLTDNNSESHILTCHLDSMLAQIISHIKPREEIFDCNFFQNTYLVTQPLNSDLSIKSSNSPEKNEQMKENFQDQINYRVASLLENNASDTYLNKFSFDLNESVFRMIHLFLSAIHVWGLDPTLDEIINSELGLIKPDIPLIIGTHSRSGIYSFCLPTSESFYEMNPNVITCICIAVISLSKVLGCCSGNFSSFVENKKNIFGEKDVWRKIFTFYQRICLNPGENTPIPPLKVEIFINSCQVKCPILQGIIPKLFSTYLKSLDQNDIIRLLKFWYKYLPHFKNLSKISEEKFDFENLELKTIALVLFGTLGSESKFKDCDCESQENYIYQTCASLLCLMLVPVEKKIHYGALQTIAIDCLGSGYVVWEQYLKMEKIVPLLLEICAKISKVTSEDRKIYSDLYLATRNALKSIASTRTVAFLNCLIENINQSVPGLNHSIDDDYFPIQNSKAEILSVIIFLLEKTPYIMILYLKEVIFILLYCVDSSHLKQENLSFLIPTIKKFRQVHHSVVSQKIAVGLATGSLILHDLRTGKTNEIAAHKDSISALKFSDDGKFLVTYSCYENRISCWQVLTGMFGLGHVYVKCTKSCQTYQLHDEEIRNHLEIASLIWIDKKSVELSLCDGTRTVFQF